MLTAKLLLLFLIIYYYDWIGVSGEDEKMDTRQVKTNIRRSDHSNGLTFSLKDINPDFLKKVFKLENTPDYLMSENGEIFSFPIDSSEFVHMDSYVVDIPGKTPVEAKQSE